MITGRPPKPTRLKVIEGNPGRRPLNANEPKPEIALPDPPISLKGLAREEWDAMAQELYKLKLLSKIDRAALAAYCQAWAIFNSAVETLNDMAARDELSHGVMIKTKSGNVIQNPVVGTINKAARDMVRFASEFGMTPSARARIAVADSLSENPLAKLLTLPGPHHRA